MCGKKQSTILEVANQVASKTFDDKWNKMQRIYRFKFISSIEVGDQIFIHTKIKNAQ